MRITLKALHSESFEDSLALQRVLESAPSYWLRISARLPLSTAAAETFAAIPEGRTLADKHVLGVHDETGRMIGCADLIRGFPVPETAMLGLLLLAESERGRGYGKLAYEALERLVLSWPEIRRVRIGVVATNEIAFPFWRARGFVETGVRRPWNENGVVSENVVLEKVLLCSG